MPTTLSRPYFAEAEFRNDLPALAQLQRKLARWLAFTKYSDLVYAPADPVVDVVAASGMGPPQNGEAGTPASQDVLIGTFPVAPPINGARRLQMRFRVLLDNATSTITIRVRSRSTGKFTDVGPVTYASLGNNTAGWVAATVPLASSVDVMQVSVYGTGAFPAHVLSYSAWYDTAVTERPDVVATDPWAYGLSQAYFVGGGAAAGLHTHALRWLVRRANYFNANHVRMLAAKWLGNRDGLGNGIARYKVWIGSPACSQVVISAVMSGFVAGGLNANGMTASVTVNVGGSTVTSANGAVGTGAYSDGNGHSYFALTQWTVNLPGGNVGPCEAEIVINNTSGVGSIHLGSIAVWEVPPTAGALALPGADTVPGAYPAIVERSARSVISAADIGVLVKGMIWAHANRPRQLVKDNIYKGLCNAGYANDYERLGTTFGPATTAARFDVLTSPDNSAARSLRWSAANAYDDSVAAANTPATVLANNWATRLAAGFEENPVQDLPVPQSGVGLIASWYGTASYNANRADWLTFQLDWVRGAGFETFYQLLNPNPGATVTVGMKVVTIPYGCAFEEIDLTP